MAPPQPSTHGYYGVRGCAPPSPILQLAHFQREDDRSMPRVGFEPGPFRKITSWGGRTELQPFNPARPNLFLIATILNLRRDVSKYICRLSVSLNFGDVHE